MRGIADPLGPPATRRRALAAAAASALALHAGPAAGKQKSCKKKARRKVDRTCGRQVEQCTAAQSQFCAGVPDPDSCQAAYAPCCAFLGECDFAGYQACLSQLR